MADNVTLSAGTADGAVIATDDITSVHYQIVKLIIGALDAGTLAVGGAGNVTAGTLRVTIATDQTQLTNALKVDGSAVTQPVSGTITAELSATDNAVLDSIAALLTTIDADTSNLSVVGGGTEAAAIRVTIASDSTGVLSIDDGGGVITVDGTVAVTNAGLTELAAAINASSQMDVNIAASNATVTVAGTVDLGATDNAVLDAIAASLALLDNSIAAGNELQVDVVAALPAGTNAVGKLLPPDIDITGHTNYMKKYYTNAGAVTDGIVWSPAAGKRWHVTCLTVNVSAACTVTFEDDKSGGDEAVMKFEFAANSGVVIPFGEKYPWASGEDAADLIVTTTAGNIYITAVGYEV